jgi:hypothetical protein
MQKTTRALLALVSVACLTAALAGCGGGSGSGGSGATSRSARATVILTDSPREEFAHVWATIYRVTLTAQDGSTVTVFEDAAGKLIDLKTLRDASGERYAFLSSASVPAGTYTAASVSVAPTMQLFKDGVATGDPLPVDGSLPKDASGNPLLTLTFKSPKTLGEGSTGNFVLDFDLARFVVRSSGVLPALGEGAGAGLGNPERHNKDEYRGTVSGLSGTSPDLTFTLTRRDGSTVTVTTSSSTALYGATALADGGTVEVRGTLDTATQTLVATAVEVRGARQDGENTPRLHGAATDIDATAGTFTLTPDGGRCLTLTQASVKVVTTADTVYRADAGATQTQADFFAALATTPTASVEGTYDAATGTLTATSVRVVDASQDGDGRPGTGAGEHFRRGGDRGNWGNGTVRQ